MESIIEEKITKVVDEIAEDILQTLDEKIEDIVQFLIDSKSDTTENIYSSVSWKKEYCEDVRSEFFSLLENNIKEKVPNKYHLDVEYSETDAQYRMNITYKKL